jgi:hypothetical protein
MPQKIKVWSIYSSWVPHNCKERLKAKIAEFFPKEIEYELIEQLGSSDEGKGTLKWIGASTFPNVVAYVEGDYYVVLYPGHSATDGWIFPSDEEFKKLFKILKEGYDDIQKGKDINAVVDDQENERVERIKKAEANSPLGQAADTLSTSVEKVKSGLKYAGLCFLGAAALGGYIYYKAHQTNVNINLNRDE